MPSGKSKTSGSENGAVVYQSRPRSQTTGGVEALLDRRPDREGRREVIAVDGQVGAVADPDLHDLAEEVILGVPREHVRKAGLDAHPDESQAVRGAPERLPGELLVAELDARQLVGPLGVRGRERHRRVEVVRAGVQAGVEDGHDEARVHGVQHVAHALFADQRRDRLAIGGVDAGRADARIGGPVGDGRGSGNVVVGDHEVLEEVPPKRGRYDGAADAPGADDEDSHLRSVAEDGAAYDAVMTPAGPR